MGLTDSLAKPYPTNHPAAAWGSPTPAPHTVILTKVWIQSYERHPLRSWVLTFVRMTEEGAHYLARSSSRFNRTPARQ